jgi:type II secretory pathway component PulF
LVPLLERWSQDERGRQKRRVRRFVQLLKEGRSLADAVEDVPGLLSDELVLAVRLDAQSGTRTAAIHQALAAGDDSPAQLAQRSRRTKVYLALMLPVALLCFMFLNLKIVPVFLKMLSEFGIEPTGSLRQSRNLMVWLMQYWWLVVVAFVALGWLFYSTAAGRILRRSALSRLFQPLRQLHASLILDQLAVAASAGRPLPGALSTLARYHQAAPVRHQLLYVRNEVEQGAPIWEAMSAVGLLSPEDVRVLATSERLGNSAWVLHKLGEIKRRRTQWRLARLSELVLPAAVLGLGVLVLLLALIVFHPLIRLIESLS